MSDDPKPETADNYDGRLADLFDFRSELENALLERLETVGSTEKDAAESLGALRGFWQIIEDLTDELDEITEENPFMRVRFSTIIGKFQAALELTTVIGLHLDVTDSSRVLEKHKKTELMRSKKEQNDKPRSERREAALREFIAGRSIEKHAAFAESIFSSPRNSKGGLDELNRIAERHGAPAFKRSTTKKLLKEMWTKSARTGGRT